MARGAINAPEDVAPTPAQIDAVNITAAKFDAVMKRWEALQK